MVEDGALSQKIEYVTILKEILNLEGHANCITGSKVTTILLNEWILPIGGASAVKGLRLQPAQQACFYHRQVRMWCTAARRRPYLKHVSPNQ